MQAADRHRISLATKIAEGIFTQVGTTLERLIRKMRGDKAEAPTIFVGGGAALLPPSRQYYIPKYYDVANAYGAALADVSGCVDVVVSLQQRENVLERLQWEAGQRAIAQGANPSALKVVDQQILPYAYASNQLARVIIRVSGKAFP